jgi:hypothetical protein
METFDMLARIVRDKRIPALYEDMVREGNVFSIPDRDPTQKAIVPVYDEHNHYTEDGKFLPDSKVPDQYYHTNEQRSLCMSKAKDRVLLPFPHTTVVLDNLVVSLNQPLGFSNIDWIMYQNMKHRQNESVVYHGTLLLDVVNDDEVDIDIQFGNFFVDINGRLLDKTKYRMDEEALHSQQMKDMASGMLVETFLALAEINTVDRFVLEISPRKKKVKKGKPGYIPKVHERPEYILLKPKEIRKYLNTSHEMTNGKKAVHERRGHPRTYPDDKERFPNVHGKTIWIDAVWCGTSEVVIKDKKYKVILDNPHSKFPNPNKNNGEKS